MNRRQPEMTETVLTVTQLTARVKTLIEGAFPRVMVLGEISNLSRAASGHIYLTLKDDGARIRCAIWRSRATRIRFDLHDGLEVVATGSLGVYAPNGQYQLYIDRMVPQGIGSLELAFRQLQQKLAAEGLFDTEHKRPLPRFPRRIALITSPTGAAVRDLLQVISRRWRAADIVILPVPVQGEGAARRIADAFREAAQVPGIDVIVAGRGGGSLEDLWAFNEEAVARAIFDCPIPVVSAVGHEVDVSIADLVADRRALTPSEAGEIVVPDRVDVRTTLDAVRDRLIAGLRQLTQHARARLDASASRRVFTHPRDFVHDRSARLDNLSQQLNRAALSAIAHRKQALSALSASLDALSPLKVLNRGYSLTTDADGNPVSTVTGVVPGDCVRTRLSDGVLTSRVETVELSDAFSSPVPRSEAIT
ncbi:MAG: exodeoxyribonuclease VII large subunit [Planctomycetaceae bacterium]